MGNQGGQGDDHKLTDEELNQDVNVLDVNPDEATPDDVKELLKTSKTLLAQKKHWRGKAHDPETGKLFKELHADAIKAQDEGKDKKGDDKDKHKKGTPADEGDEDTNVRVKKLETSEEKRQFGHANSLTPEEADQVFAYAQGMGIPPEEALQKDFMKNALEAFRKAKKNEAATPGASSKSPQVEGKTFVKMDRKQKKEHFHEIVKQSTEQK